MARTEFRLPSGARVTIEGDSADVEEIVQAIAPLAGRGAKPRPGHELGPTRVTAPEGPMGRIRSLTNEGFFKEKRSLSSVQEALEERGFIYRVTALSPTLIRLVRAKQLRRVKEKGIWLYVNP